MEIIAVEEHIVSRAINRATGGIISQTYPFYQTFLNPPPADAPDVAQLFGLGEARLRIMDQAGIAMEIVSYTNASQWLFGEEAIRLVRAANDSLAQAIRPWPERFCGFAALPWQDAAAAAEEAARAVSELGFVGVLISGRPQTDAVFLDDKKYDPVWKALTGLDAPVYVHPNFPCREVCGAYYSGLGDQVDTVLSAYGFGWHLEAGVQVIRMILGGVFDRFPGLKVISGHWGEMVPYWLARLDQMLPPNVTGLSKPVSAYYRSNVWVTPSGIYDADCLEFCLRKMGSDHLLFSTDYPYISESGARPFLENSPLSPQERQKFACENAKALFHLG